MAQNDELPRVIVNAKVYPQATGNALTRLAQAASAVAQEAGITIGVAPPMVELAALGRANLPGLHVYAQHVDPLPAGAGTGHTTVESVLAAGAVGTLLNHAEHKIPATVVAATGRAQEAGLATLLCADSMAEVESLAQLRPTFVAVEPPELIGGDVSVTSADPGIVSHAAAAVRRIAPETLPLCGAGVKDGRDVSAAIGLGAYGVLLASGVVKAADPAAVLRDLVSGLP